MAQLTGDINVAKVFEKYRHFMSDVSMADYIGGGVKTTGFGEVTPVFNDGITFRIASKADQHKYDIPWGRRVLVDAFGAGTSVMRVDNGTGMHIKLRVVAVDGMSMEECISRVKQVLDEHKRVRMVSIDFTMDCENITTRKDVETWLPDDAVIAERSTRVGNHCISWFDVSVDGGKIRCKVYNKVVQLMESAGLFEKNGSSLHVLMKDCALRDTVLRFKEQGVSRIEVTFYSEAVFDMQHYVDALHDMHHRLRTCRTYVVDVGMQWDALSTCITQTIALYHVPSETFGYCHWWNSLTGKMQGASRSNIKAKDVPKLLSNYSFYDRPMYFIKISDGGDEVTEIYMRVDGGDLMTMIPGERGGFYPSNPAHHPLADYGMGSVAPGYIGWKRSYNHKSKPLAEIKEVLPVDIVDVLASELMKMSVNPKDYSCDYDVLEVGMTYKIISYGPAEYYGRLYMFAKTADGKNIRCTVPLKEILESREKDENTEIFEIRVTDKVNPCGKKTTRCVVV